MRLFLSLEHFEAISGLLIGLISVFLLKNREAQEEERDGEWPVGGSVRSHNIYQLSLWS